ncbi:MAG: hypothetical protein ACFUZC_07895 [Chthoniobacteraceae bacterium]
MKISRSMTGFSLVELTFALGVASFCLLSILGLIPVGLTSNQNAVYQTVATGLMSTVAADLRATQRTIPATAQTSPRFQLSIPVSGGTAATQTLYFREGGDVIGEPNTSATSDARYRATITWIVPDGSSPRCSTAARILVTWPALVDPSPASLPSKFIGSVETIMALDRN